MIIPKKLFKKVKQFGFKGPNDYMDIVNWLELSYGIFLYVKPYNNEFQQVPRFMWIVEELHGIKRTTTSYFIKGKTEFTNSRNAYISGLEFSINGIKT